MDAWVPVATILQLFDRHPEFIGGALAILALAIVAGTALCIVTVLEVSGRIESFLDAARRNGWP